MKVSPQLKWARKQKKMGRCTRCGEKRNKFKQLCDACQVKQTAYMKTWRKRGDNQRTDG